MSAPPRKNELFSVQTMTFVAGLLMTAFASFNTFQKDASVQIGRLEERIDALKDRVAALERAR